MKNPKIMYEHICRDLEKEELRLSTLKKRDGIERSYNKILALRKLVSDKDYWDEQNEQFLEERRERKKRLNKESYAKYRYAYDNANKVWCETQVIDNKAKNKCKEIHKYTCQRCGRTVAETRIEGHHIIPIGVEGCTNDQANLVCLCHKCHRQLHQELRTNPTDNYYTFTARFIGKI